MPHRAQTFALLHPVVCAQQPTLSSIHLREYSSSIWGIPAPLRTHLKWKTNKRHMELDPKRIKKSKCGTVAFERRGNIWPIRSLTHWNPKWLYCKEDISGFLKSLLLHFAACWARHQLSPLANTGTSLMSPTQCQNCKPFHINLILKGQNLKDQASITECMFTLSLLGFFSFLRYFSWHFPQLWGCFLLSLYGKWLYLHAHSSWVLIWLVYSYEYNTGQTSVFWGKK